MKSVYRSIEEAEDKLFLVLPQGIGVGVGLYMKKSIWAISANMTMSLRRRSREKAYKTNEKKIVLAEALGP